MADVDSTWQRYMKRRDALFNERTTWVEHWRDIAYYLVPRRFRYLPTERNKGWKKNQFIINNTATRALRTLAAGMMAGITSPARPWFRLTLPDQDRAAFGPNRAWLDAAEQALLDSFAKSNIYNALHNVYEDLGGFCSSVMYIEEDVRDTLRAYVFPVGQYMLANSSRLEVDSVYRDLSMTVGQMVEAFGVDACSGRVQDAWKNGRTEEWVELLHVIEPNREFMPGKYGQKAFPWKSCWTERSSETQENKFLRESGFAEFPCMAPRWSVAGEDVYGSGPGMDTLGDVKALQTLERRKAQGVDKLINPPMKVPSSLMNQRVSMLPGDNIYVDANVTGQTVEPAITIPPAGIQVTEASIREHEGRIKSALYEDLWLSLTDSEGDMTAREVAERHEEKMLQLGPVMERIENELLDPLVDRSIGILFRARKLPPTPPDMRGQELRVEFISIMSQAQKLLQTGGIERLTTFVTNLAAIKPEALDKVDLDKGIEAYADSLGVPSELIVPQEQVEAIRAQRAKQQQQQAQVEQAATAAKAAKDASGASLEGDTALSRVAAALPLAAQGGVPGAT